MLLRIPPLIATGIMHSNELAYTMQPIAHYWAGPLVYASGERHKPMSAVMGFKPQAAILHTRIICVRGAGNGIQHMLLPASLCSSCQGCCCCS